MTTQNKSKQPLSIHFEPSRDPNRHWVKLSDGFNSRTIGEYFSAEKLLYTKRKFKHLHRLSNSLGVNSQLVNDYQIDMIKILYESELMYVHVGYLFHYGKIHQYGSAGYEKQIFLELSEFASTPEAAFEKWNSLKASLEAERKAQAAKEAQITMFPAEVNND
jgi:hypothetical protein